MKKIRNMNEIAWVVGIILCALGVALYTKADFGLSMISAPGYIIHTKMIEHFAWYTQGTSEYIFQTVIILVLWIVMSRFKKTYILTFLVAVISGMIIDGWFVLLGGNAPFESMAARILAFISGEIALTIAIAFLFRTTMPVQIYELAVNEISEKWSIEKSKVKQVFDVFMLFLSVVLALVLNGNLQGLGIGTIIITIVNAPLIKFFGEIIDRIFSFESRIAKIEKAMRKED